MEPKKSARYFDSSKKTKKKASGTNSEKSRIGGKNKGRIVKKKDTIRHQKGNEKFKVSSKLIKSEEKKQFPGKATISKELLEKHSRGEGFDTSNIKHKLLQKKIKRKERHFNFANKQAARTELLLTENTGYLEADAGETTTQFTQKQIAHSVDIAAASKSFELKLEQFGPYRMKYSHNGRHLLIGGKMGHVAAFDWVTKHLHCEINVMESVHDISWMHIETMFAAAQKDWVYMYDNKGTELHCVKKLNKVLRMEFLPYHFLLATGSELGYLSWLDISIGEIAGQYRTSLGKISVMKQNPHNAVLCVGQTKGVVSMWSPKVKNPLASMLCHKSPLSALAIDPRGMYMATSGIDKSVKVWDIRNLEGPLQTYILRSAPSHLEFSYNNLLAIGMGNVVEVYRDCIRQQATRAYLQHKMTGYIGNMSFCPYEDVLGVSTDKGFVSLIVPGCGEANFDALESNPYQSKSQRREAEVKALLEKIQPELISLNPSTLAEIDVPTLKEKIEARSKLLYLKPKKVDYTPRNRKKLKGTAKKSKNKKIVQETAKREFLREMRENKLQQQAQATEIQTKSFGVLDRFIKKKR